MAKRPILTTDSGMPVYGAIRRTEGIVTPSRHLGLIPAAERQQAAGQAIRTMGDLITAHCDLTALLQLANSAPELTAKPTPPAVKCIGPMPTRLRTAVIGRVRRKFDEVVAIGSLEPRPRSE